MKEGKKKEEKPDHQGKSLTMSYSLHSTAMLSCVQILPICRTASSPKNPKHFPNSTALIYSFHILPICSHAFSTLSLKKITFLKSTRKTETTAARKGLESEKHSPEGRGSQRTKDAMDPLIYEVLLPIRQCLGVQFAPLGESDFTQVIAGFPFSSVQTVSGDQSPAGRW